MRSALSVYGFDDDSDDDDDLHGCELHGFDSLSNANGAVPNGMSRL